jgi:hypothetical protein
MGAKDAYAGVDNVLFLALSSAAGEVQKQKQKPRPQASIAKPRVI